MEDVVNVALKGRDYGSGGQIVVWALIPTILNPHFLESTGYQEIRKYHKKRRVIEFSLRIDHATFKAADDAGRRKHIFAMVLRSVEEARAMKNLPPFDFQRFEADLLQIGRQHGWR